MKDVAQRAGVSLSTVSYVLSGSRPISGPTRARILSAMDELNFHPNAVARALASKRTKVLALLLSPQERGLGHSELEFVRGATEAARNRDHHLVLLTAGMDSEADLSYLKHQGLVDGLILMEVRLDDPRIPLLQKLGLPFTMLGRSAPTLVLPFVDIDFDTTYQTLLEYLVGLGHRRIAFVNQSREVWASGYGPAVRAQQAFEHSAGALGVTALSVFSSSTPRDGWEACQPLLDASEPPTALVVMNDGALPGILLALSARCLRIPEDISVVSACSSSLVSETLLPALTSADAPSRELARLAVENLIQSIEDPEAALQNVLLPCQLIIRASSASFRTEPERKNI